jgi:hypothetical protein
LRQNISAIPSPLKSLSTAEEEPPELEEELLEELPVQGTPGVPGPVPEPSPGPPPEPGTPQPPPEELLLEELELLLDELEELLEELEELLLELDELLELLKGGVT